MWITRPGLTPVPACCFASGPRWLTTGNFVSSQNVQSTRYASICRLQPGVQPASTQPFVSLLPPPRRARAASRCAGRSFSGRTLVEYRLCCSWRVYHTLRCRRNAVRFLWVGRGCFHHREISPFLQLPEAPRRQQQRFFTSFPAGRHAWAGTKCSACADLLFRRPAAC